ncbi:hypothetical protein HOLleu_28623 [Holothuria leucospilota]|uniref:Uncharacterized protein n=1 Tax=Holothuria leucospilota TaxID=206669 RepID=A0A9Q1BMN6_HOLLE|nr:hypothetical protein HOLleu_28623 [Holothuria leucospilota]
MTLRELEETVDDQDEVMKRSSSSTGNASFKVQGGNLHSTQSMTGRQSLLTLDHVQYTSASDALNVYINSFEESHPLETSSYIYRRTPEDLLLPQSVLSKTVKRSLETGKNDTKEEFHLHNVKGIIDESYDEILRADLEKERADSVLPSSELLTRIPSSEVSSLPDPDQAIKMTPLLKSTPIQNYSYVQSSKASRTASLKKTDEEARKYKKFNKFGSIPRSSQKRQETRSAMKYLSKNDNKIPASVSKYSQVDNFPVSLDSKQSQMKGVQSPALNDSHLSGGRPPPSWVDELDNSQVASVSERIHGSAAKKGASSNQKKFGYGEEHLLKGGTEVGSVSSYGIDEIAVLKEAEGIIEQRRHERRRKEAEAHWMKKRWQIDRRNESMFEKPMKMRTKPQRTESVTTDDLVTASPYGLDKRKYGSFDKVPLFVSGKLRNVTHLHPHQSSALAFRTRNHFLSRSDGSMPERTRSYRESKLSASNLLKPPVRPHLLTPDMLRKVGESPKPHLPSHGTKLRASVNRVPRTVPSSCTDSLLLASPFGEAKSETSAHARKMESPHVFRKKFKTLDERYSESCVSQPSTFTDTGGGATLGTVGDTSRVDAVISRAQRLMGESPGDEYPLHYKRSPLDSTYPGSIIDRYLGDCIQVSQQNSDQQRPLESLKQILFTLQDLEEIQGTQTHHSDKLQSKEVSFNFKMAS